MAKYSLTYDGELRTTCTHEGNGQVLRLDAPKDNQGKGEFFSPTDLVAAGLGSCILTLMGIVANHLGVSIEGTTATVEKEMRAAPSRRIGKLTVVVNCPHTFEKQIARSLEKSSENCPVHASLHDEVEQVILFNWGTGS